ncbi:hypothetical protein Ocin01_07405 [Orchesella cincta]|uniref:Uncharacterized protein n=1 Tax=Orchesella cincta TaxID=48709 RepID=A0A1D2N2J6_ORCCI|nr:hypothetical protein Ocin01_07405 [Orchesella cincta]
MMASSKELPTNSGNLDISSMSMDDIMAHPLTLVAVNDLLAWHIAKANAILDEVNAEEKEMAKNKQKQAKKQKKNRKPMRKTVKKQGETVVAATALAQNPFGKRMAAALFKKFSRKKMKNNNGSISTQEDEDSLPELSEPEEEELNPELAAEKDNKKTFSHYALKKKLSTMHYDKIQSMNALEVGEICNQILPVLREIDRQNVPTKRNQMFQETIGRHLKSLYGLIKIRVNRPFSYIQDKVVFEIIKNDIYPGADESDEQVKIFNYVIYVLAPEALIRIFALVNDVDVKLAETEMLNPGGKYYASLPPYIISNLSDDLRMLLDE